MEEDAENLRRRIALFHRYISEGASPAWTAIYLRQIEHALAALAAIEADDKAEEPTKQQSAI